MHKSCLVPYEPKYIFCDGYYLKKNEYTKSYDKILHFNLNKPNYFISPFSSFITGVGGAYLFFTLFFNKK